MKVSRKTVAERAGVTKESVSYVLNRSRPVSPEIVAKVMAAVEELGYVPDVGARSLGNKKTLSVGVICNDLSNPFYSEVIHGIESGARQRDYTLLIAEAAGSVKRQIANMLARRVDGVLLLVFPDKFEFDYDAITAQQVKLVVTHNTALSGSFIAHLEPDFEQGITDALAALKAAGHSDIVMLSAFSSEHTFDNRLFHFCACYKKLFGREASFLCLSGSNDSTLESGRALAEQLLTQGKPLPSAVLTTNDMMAIGAMQKFLEAGIAVPKNISVVGIDDMLFSTLVTPTLSTVGYDKIAYGKALFSLLYDSIYFEKTEQALFPMRYIGRQSVAKISDNA